MAKDHDDAPKPRGRPPLDANDPSVRVGVSLPAQKYDALCRQALRQDLSVPEVIRRVIYGNTYTEKKSTK